MAALFLIFRPAAHFAQLIVANLILVPGLTNLVRWQNHWHVVRQGWTFFQNDFAGRIAARVMQTGPALRESVVLSVAGIWYILVYGPAIRCSPPPIGGSLCRSSSGSSCMAGSCRAFCRRCASARGRCRRCARS